MKVEGFFEKAWTAQYPRAIHPLQCHGQPMAWAWAANGRQAMPSPVEMGCPVERLSSVATRRGSPRGGQVGAARGAGTGFQCGGSWCVAREHGTGDPSDIVLPNLDFREAFKTIGSGNVRVICNFDINSNSEQSWGDH